MSTLHASATLLAGADVDMKRADSRSHGRYVVVVLHRDIRLDHQTGTRRTRLRERRVVLFIDERGHRAARAPTIRGPWLPAGTSWMRRGAVLGKRRGLSLGRTPREVEFLLQSIVLAPQPIALPLDPFEFTPQPLALGFCALCPLAPLALVRWLIVAALWHATVMADSRKLYKYEILESEIRSAQTRVRTR
jgi:hypothetical protein